MHTYRERGYGWLRIGWGRRWGFVVFYKHNFWQSLSERERLSPWWHRVRCGSWLFGVHR